LSGFDGVIDESWKVKCTGYAKDRRTAGVDLGKIRECLWIGGVAVNDNNVSTCSLGGGPDGFYTAP
jgi:hypothetical protein